MKKMLIMLALSLLAVGQTRAQEENASEGRAQKRAEMIQKSGERLAKTFGLESAARDSFLAIYTEYQNEMFATNEHKPRTKADAEKTDDGKKELTDEQAKQRIEENLQRQQRQVEQLQQRLEIQTRYYPRFTGVLTPAQTLKAMFPQRPRPQGNSQQGGGQNPRGGFGGPEPF